MFSKRTRSITIAFLSIPFLLVLVAQPLMNIDTFTQEQIVFERFMLFAFPIFSLMHIVGYALYAGWCLVHFREGTFVSWLLLFVWSVVVSAFVAAVLSTS